MKIITQPWLDRARKNIKQFFDKKKNVIYSFTVLAPEVFMDLKGLAATKNNKCAAVLDHELDLQNQLKGLANRFEMPYEDDFIYSLHPYTGVGFFASAFGCRTEFPENGDPITHPAITSINQVDDLKVDIKNADLVNLTLDKIKYFLDQTGGKVPISYPDLQSPIDNASIICNYTELMCGFYTAPEKVHQLMRMITDVMIEVLDKIKELIPDSPACMNWFLPEGIWLSDDLMATMSPLHYEQFSIPYSNELSKKYGGVFLHSCGNPLPCIDILDKHHNFLGLDFWEVSVKEFLQKGGNFPVSCAVFEDTWHNLDRRQARTDPNQAFRDAIEDISKLPSYAENGLLVFAICPHPDHAQEYHNVLIEAVDKANNQ